MTFLHKITLGCLGLSTLVNVFLGITLKNQAEASVQVIKAAQSRAKEAEEREQARVDHLLQRINTEERIHVAPDRADIPALSERKPYISDFEYDDENWEEYITQRKEPAS